jgi:hypothetical protein
MATNGATPKTTACAMIATIVPFVPYRLSKATHNVITPQKAKKMAETAADNKYRFRAT